ncbi:Oligoendopeptidase F, plasmid [Mycoplasmopsis maculosa]|uniref:Oligopeptidase F n=1 Tax=Mycoplasmopsis maculosa TaxID=114885 RepID=A0A449B4B6_9BACT|nr:oligoendopeptidase F [Mycoplasmopsis maculosa]VEU75442.1 Oligoendopeptidase F, plasmid [Mycoplasmopsis maculosa]
MKKIDSYDKVDKKYKFDLDDILKDKTIEELFSEYLDLSKEMIRIKDSKYNDIESYISALKFEDEVAILTNKISNYLSNKSNINLVDPEIKKLEAQSQKIFEEFINEFGSETNRFYANIEKIKSWIDDPRLSEYKNSLIELINNKKHKLSNDVEEYIIKTSVSTPSLENIFDILSDSELVYEKVKLGKRKFILDSVSYSKLIKNKNKDIRKQAVDNFRKAKLVHKESFTNLLYDHLKMITVEAKTRNYKNSIEMLCYSDKVENTILEKLFENVKKIKSDIYEYNKSHKKFYELKFKDKYDSKYDFARELIKVKNNYSIEEIQKIILEAFKPYGDEYYNTIKKAFNENWIDYMSVNNKISGAYSIGESYGVDKKYILMNYDGEFESLETLAHELGHSMHSYFSDKNNSYVNSMYTIFLAEIASTFNELILYDYLLNNSRTDEEKFYLTSKIIDNFIGTVYKQTMWAEYEYNLYDKIEKNEISPSYSEFAKTYYEVTKKYIKKSLKYNEQNNIAAVTVPHFYYGFYVYKYAIGLLVSNFFFKKYKENKNFLKIYIKEFLSSGSRYSTLETLKRLEVDLLSEDFYNEATAYFKTLVDQYSTLGNKIFKQKKNKI